MTAIQVCTILYIEDDADDIYLFQHAFTHSSVPCTVHCVPSAEQARAYLLGDGKYEDRHRFPLPDLIISDLVLPLESGRRFVEWVRGQARFSGIELVCLTGSDEPRKLQPIADLGISIIKKEALFDDAIAFIRNVFPS